MSNQQNVKYCQFFKFIYLHEHWRRDMHKRPEPEPRAVDAAELFYPLSLDSLHNFCGQ
jgi:hypothetical protein